MKKGVVFFLFLLSSLLLFAIMKIVGFNGLYGQDSYEYLRYARELKEGISTAHAPVYFAPIYSALGALLSFIFNPIDSLQLISIFSLGFTLVVAYYISKRIAPESKHAVIFLFCFGFLSPYFLRLGTCDMSDSLACLLLNLTVLAAVVFYQTNAIKYLLAAILLAIICLFTRFATAIPLSVLFVQLLVLKRKEIFSRAGYLLIAIVPILIVVVILYPDIFDKPFKHPLISELSFLNFFRSSFNSSDGFAAYTFPNALFMLFPFIHPGFIFIGILLLFFYPKEYLKKPEIQFCILPALGYLFFLSLLPVQNTRLQTLVFPLIIIAYLPAFDKLVLKIRQVNVAVIAVVVQLLFITLAMKGLFQLNRVERQITTQLKPLQSNYVAVYELGCDGFLPAYDVNIAPVSLFSAKLDTVKDSSLLLIQTAVFEKQWKGKLPEENLALIKERMVLSKMRNFELGWELYSLRKKD